MDRLGSSLALAALLFLPAACGDDSPPVGSGTESETGTGSSGTDTSGATMTVTSNTDAMTSDGSSGGTTNTTSVDTTEGTTTVDPTTSDTGTGTTTAGDECEMCVADNCDGELNDCLAEPDCACWLECIADGNNGMTCGMMCNGMPPGELGDFFDCVDNDCNAECNGGGMDGETYMECAEDVDCPMTDCSGFLGYCSVDCMGDAGNCPLPATGNVEPICGGMQDNRCILPCGGGGDTCPDGMDCVQGGGGGGNMICAFP